MNRAAACLLSVMVGAACVAPAMAQPVPVIPNILCMSLQKFEKRFAQQGDNTILWQGKTLDGSVLFLLQPNMQGRFLLGKLNPHGHNVCFVAVGKYGVVLPYEGTGA